MVVFLIRVRDRIKYQQTYYSKIIESNKNRVFDENVKKECNLCHNFLPSTPKYFYKNSRALDGLDWRCKICRKDTHDKHNHLKGRYNLSLEEYNKLVDSQNGVCAICGKEELCVDHDHKTGEVRGLLCNRCNSAVGFLEMLIREKLLDKTFKYLKGELS